MKPKSQMPQGVEVVETKDAKREGAALKELEEMDAAPPADRFSSGLVQHDDDHPPPLTLSQEEDRRKSKASSGDPGTPRGAPLEYTPELVGGGAPDDDGFGGGVEQ